MSIWVRAFCTQPLGSLTVQDLHSLIANADFMMMAEMQSLSEEVGLAAEGALRFEGPPGELTEARLFYRSDNPAGLFIAVDRWRGDDARASAEETVERLAQRSDAGGARIRDVLSRAIEVVTFCLKESDADGMGGPITWHLAMRLAERGAGLVDTDNGKWWDPETYRAV